MSQTNFENSRLVEKERFFREFQVWPVLEDFDSEGWLSNFDSNEKWVAEHLLVNFVYINERMTNSLLKASISNYFGTPFDLNNPVTERSGGILDNTAFVICEGEKPNPTDSGNLFARKLRDQLSCPENRILLPSQALARNKEFSRFIFIDDFAGSGNQFVETWKRKRQINRTELAFDDLSRDANLSFVYCCCIATKKAESKILETAPGIKLSPAHMISEHYSVVNPASPIWNDMDANNAIQIIQNTSRQAGYATEDCGENDWRGFHALGLSLAFNHGIPDASLPIFYSQRNKWVPLMRRSKS